MKTMRLDRTLAELTQSNKMSAHYRLELIVNPLYETEWVFTSFRNLAVPVDRITLMAIYHYNLRLLSIFAGVLREKNLYAR